MTTGKKAQGGHSGVYTFDRIEVNEPKYPVAYFSNTAKECFSNEYAMDIDVFIELGRPDRIKVEDLIEAVK